MGQKKKWTDHPIPSFRQYESGQKAWAGNPEVLVKRPHNDIPVRIYFFRTPAFLIYFYNGLFTRRHNEISEQLRQNQEKN